MFVVDSAIFQKEVRDVAEFLYNLLTDPVVSRNSPTVLVACNKQGDNTEIDIDLNHLGFYLKLCCTLKQTVVFLRMF